MTLYKGNKVIAGSRSYIGNIGDIKYTARVDLPFGGSWCDGSIKLKAQFPTVYQMLIDGKLQALDIATYESALNLNGSCGFFGLDTATESFRVPSLNDVYIKSGQEAETFGAESLPNIKGETSSNRKEGKNSGPFYTSETTHEWYGDNIHTNVKDLGFDASLSSSTYQDGAKVNPDHVKYRAYVILYSGIDLKADITKQVQLNNPFFLGMSQWFDCDPKNASWLLSDGAFHSGAIYESFYNWLLSEYNNPDMLPNKINADIVGNPVISNGVAGGFSTSNYLRIPDQLSAENNEWEIVIGLTTGDSVGGSYNQVFYTGGYNSSNRAIWAYINKDANRFGIGLGSGGSEWVSYLTGTSAALPNTKYLIRVSKKTNKYTLEISTDNGLTYNLEASLDATFSLPTYTPYLGMYVGSTNDYSFKGSVDLSQSYIKINGEIWWRGFANNVKKASELCDDYDYVINTESRTFRLPVKTRTASGNAVCGNGTTLGLTNGTSNFGLTNVSGQLVYCSVTSPSSYGVSVGDAGTAIAQTPYGASYGVTTDPSKSGIETSSNGLKLYFYVGETVQDANLINASKVLDLLAKLESYDYVVERQEGSTDLYIWYTERYKSGYVRQYFLFPQKTSYTMQTVKMPISMANTDYIAMPSVSDYIADNSMITFTHMSIINKTTTTFQTRNDNAFVKQVMIYGKAA